MNTPIFIKKLSKTHQSSIWLMFLLSASVSPAQSPPTITSVTRAGTNLVVTTSVPAGARRVYLESQERLAPTGWEPRAIARLDGKGGQFTFRLPCTLGFEALRIRAEATDPLPESFYTAKTNFLSDPGTANGISRDGGGVLTYGPDSPPTDSREVVESDIWKIRGDTVYFFNQYRGLQVIDISDPAAPVLRGQLDFPDTGEQMYLLDPDYVLLLGRDACNGGGQVLIIKDTKATPAVVATVPVEGYILESRLVGTALYIASQAMRPQGGTNTTTWGWGTIVSAFDLADPASPVAMETIWYPGSENTVYATDTLLFVVGTSPGCWWQSIIHVVDITSPDGAIFDYETITPAGTIPDKFKLNYANGIFTCISEDRHWDGGTRLVTTLETFRLPDPRSDSLPGVTKLGQLELGRGERLQATRFNENLVYIVTFFQIDPLWVVDLSDPVNPRIAGSVDVPGWSTYIEPVGTQLVTMGFESNRVAVSLFDVQDPSAPALLSRVRLGEGYAWSEANYNEKAFGVFPDAGLILVPYNGWTSNGYAMRVQLIDLLPSSLVARGAIEHDVQPRRATVIDDYILSISGRELISVDAIDRDQPQLQSTLELAWPVDKVIVHGDYLIQLSGGSSYYGYYWWWWNSQPTAPTLLVSPAASPNQILRRLALSNNYPVLGTAVQGDRLYIAQGPSFPFFVLPMATLNVASDTDTNPALLPNFFLTVVDLSVLPAIQVTGETAIQSPSFGWGGNLQAVFPQPNVLVWSGGNEYFWRWHWLINGPVVIDSLWCPWPPWGNGGHLLAFDVSDPTKPEFASEVQLAGTSYWYWFGFSEPFAAQGLVYLSHKQSEFVPGLVSASQTSAQTTVSVDSTGVPVTNIVSGTWVTRDYLDVIDYADPRQPTVRKPVNIAGTLKGLSHEGALLYTMGAHWTTNWTSASYPYLDALAYDGVTAHLVDSLPLPDRWYNPLVVLGTNVILANVFTATATNSALPAIQTWTLNPDGKFVRLGAVPLESSPYEMASMHDLLAVRNLTLSLELFDLSDPATLRPIGKGSPPGCLGFNIENGDGNAQEGLWLPLGEFGVWHLPVEQ